MAKHSWSDLWDRQAESIEYNRKLMETYMMAVQMSAAEREFHEQCGCAACKETLAWYATKPVADTEASETRGVVEDTLTERGKNYGDFTDNAKVAQGIKFAMLYSPGWDNAEHYMREALELIASKIGRLLSGDPYHVDGWHDIQGYAKLVEQRIKQTERK